MKAIVIRTASGNYMRWDGKDGYGLVERDEATRFSSVRDAAKFIAEVEAHHIDGLTIEHVEGDDVITRLKNEIARLEADLAQSTEREKKAALIARKSIDRLINVIEVYAFRRPAPNVNNVFRDWRQSAKNDLEYLNKSKRKQT